MLNRSFGIEEGVDVLSQVALTLVDTDARVLGVDAAALQSQLRAVSPTAIVLCCSLEEPGSYVRAATYWLPALEAFSCASGPSATPVLLCGTKSDTFAGEAVGGEGGA